VGARQKAKNRKGVTTADKRAFLGGGNKKRRGEGVKGKKKGKTETVAKSKEGVSKWGGGLN